MSTFGNGWKLCGCDCQRLISWMTSAAFWRLRKLIRFPGNASLLPSCTNVSVVKKTPRRNLKEINNQKRMKLTNKWYTRRGNLRKRGTIIGEVFVGVNSHLTSAKLRHESRIDLLPRSLQSTDRGRVEARNDGNHARIIMDSPTTLQS